MSVFQTKLLAVHVLTRRSLGEESAGSVGIE